MIVGVTRRFDVCRMQLRALGRECRSGVPMSPLPALQQALIWRRHDCQHAAHVALAHRSVAGGSLFWSRCPAAQLITSFQRLQPGLPVFLQQQYSLLAKSTGEIARWCLLVRWLQAHDHSAMPAELGY